MKKKMNGSVTVLVMMLFGMIVGMLLFGWVTPAVQWLSFDNAFDENGEFHYDRWNVSAGDVLNEMREYMMTPLGAGTIVASLVVGLFTGLSGTGQMGATVLNYLIPAIIISIVANLFFFPVIDFANGEGLPFPLNFILLGVYNLLLYLTLIQFVTGRD